MKLLQNHKSIIIFLLSLMPLVVQGNDENEIKRGIQKLNIQIAQNEINDALGRSHLNKYIVRLDDQNPTYIKYEKAKFIQEDLTQLDQELADLATNYKVHFYILLNGSQLSVGKLDKQNQSVRFGSIDSASFALSRHIDAVVLGIYNKSNISSLGGGKNVLLSITPVQRVKVDLKNQSKDELYFTYLRRFKQGSAFPELLNILRYRYASNDNVVNTLYSKDPYSSLITQKKLYSDILTKYDQEVEKLYPGKTPSSKAFHAAHISDYYANPPIKAVIDEIGTLIDEDEKGYLELKELMDNSLPFFGPIDVGVKYTYFNKDFTIIKGIGSKTDEFEDFKQSILTYRKYRQNIIELAGQIGCEPKSDEANAQFKARVYYCAALLTPATAANLTLEMRQNLLCALSTLELSGSWTVARDQLTTDENKEEVVVRILVNTPEDQRRQLLEYFDKQTLPSGSLSIPIFSNLVKEIDSQNFQDMMLLLVDWIQHYFPKGEQVWLDIIHNSERESRAILPLGTFRDGYSIGIASYKGNSIIQYHITENDIPIKSHRVSAGLLDYVVIKFEDSYTIGGKSFEEGSVHAVPSLFAYLIMHNMKVSTKVAIGKYTLYATGLLIGATEIVAAKTLFQATVALVDMGVASSDIVVNEVLAEDLNKTEEGKEFLDKWNKYVLLYAGGRVVTQLSGVLDDLSSAANRIERDDVNKLTEKIVKKSQSGQINGSRKIIYPIARINGVPVVRILEGSNGKIAIIGRKMEYVRQIASDLRKLGKEVELFEKTTAFNGQGYNNLVKIELDWEKTLDLYGTNGIIPYGKIKGTLWYQENQRWAKWIRENGYSVYDLGDNPGMFVNAPDRSAFYDIEKIEVFGDIIK